jgi:oxygen-dependent protoporphyrinogen oxidase
MTRPRVVVIGGGITGLACAYRLRDAAEVTVLESSPRVGGNLVTVARDGFILDGGPDSWVAAKPHASALCSALGLGDELIGTRPETRRVYVAYNGALYPLPEGLVLGIPTRFGPMVSTRLFSPLAKLRMGLEPMVAVKHGDDDESVWDFIVRRLGVAAAERLAGPLLGGIFAGDPKALSVRAAFPQLVEMERKYGSLILAMRASRKAAAASGGKSAFVTLRGGIATLPEALAQALGDRIKTRATVAAVEQDGGWKVRLTSGERIAADHVVLAAPQRSLPGLVRGLDEPIARLVEGIRIGSSATAFVAYRREQVTHALDAVGFIGPRAENTRVIAATWVSSKWPHRAPEGCVLLRAFFGGIGYDDVLQSSDDALVAAAREELPGFMGPIHGDPLFSQVFRWTKASPQPELGHLARMREIHARLAAHPGLHLAGNGYDGSGIPDCIKQGEAVAGRIAAGG